MFLFMQSRPNTPTWLSCKALRICVAHIFFPNFIYSTNISLSIWNRLGGHYLSISNLLGGVTLTYLYFNGERHRVRGRQRTAGPSTAVKTICSPPSIRRPVVIRSQKIFIYDCNNIPSTHAVCIDTTYVDMNILPLLCKGDLDVYVVLHGEQYLLCYGAFNATAVALSAVGSVSKSNQTADSATAVALNAP